MLLADFHHPILLVFNQFLLIPCGIKTLTKAG